MKIIENNHNKEKEKIIIFNCTCPNCNSILECNERDIKYDEEEDEEYIVCPCCNMAITNEYFDREVTLDNISYPFDFYKCGNSNSCVNLSDEEINNYIKKCVDFLKYNPNEPYKYIGTGDSLIIVFNHEDEYYFVVAKNYENAIIDKT